MTDRPTLHLFCGKAAAGKSTLAADIAECDGALLVSEDFWTSRLFGPELKVLADYVRYSRRLKAAMGPHLIDLLRAGNSIALDFQANTRATRAWMKEIIDASGADHRLHFLDVDTEACRARVHARNAAGSHEFTLSDEQFDLFTSYFEPPDEDEGFTIVVHGDGPAAN
jgi:predicted kinase